MAKKARVGDVLEVQVPAGFAYVQYLGKHPGYGDVIRVLPGVHAEQVTDFSALVAAEGYCTFYPATAFVARGFTRVVHSGPLPAGVGVPTTWRRVGARAPSGEIRTWVIEAPGEQIVRKELTDSERQLPIAAIWDHEYLVQSLSEGWSPAQEG